MTIDRTTGKLLDLASNLTLDDLPAVARTAAKARILSTLGVSLAAFDMEPVRISRKLAQPVAAGPSATILGSLQTCAPDMAAFVNSAMVRSLGVFEGKYGLWQQMMRGETFDLPIPTSFAGHTFAVQQTMIKSFPTRFNCQVPVFAAQKLRTMVDVGEIESLKIEAIRQAFERWLDVPEVWKPQTRETADHSLPCTVAMALLDGTITPHMMQHERFKGDYVLALMGKCTIELPDEFADIAPAVRSCRLTARLRNGKSVVAEYRRSLGDDEADPGWTQAVDKFDALTRERLPGKAREGIVARVSNLESERDLSGLIALTQLEGVR